MTEPMCSICESYNCKHRALCNNCGQKCSWIDREGNRVINTTTEKPRILNLDGTIHLCMEGEGGREGKGWINGGKVREDPNPNFNIVESDLEIAACNPIKHTYKPEILDNIYRVKFKDTWRCNNCKDSGDKWYMMIHDCKFLRNQAIAK